MVALLLLSLILVFLECVLALSLSQSSQSQHTIRVLERTDLRDDIGFTSLSILPLTLNQNRNLINDYIVVGGTKRGSLDYFYLVHDASMNEKDWITVSNRKYFDLAGLPQICSPNNFKHEYKPYPIYSLAFLDGPERSKDDIVLAVGGGDRLLTFVSCGNVEDISISSTVGPHTGWVKDILASTTKSTQVHSIGCNCIETWSKNKNSEWMHLAKRKIESTVQGSTLSSDLLCLCPGPLSTYIDTFTFFSGGVDGRIHQWSDDVTVEKPLYSVLAHDGRVNCLSFSTSAMILFSAGHDGLLQCRCFQDQTLAQTRSISTTLISSEGYNDSIQRFSYIEILKEEQNSVYILLGTTQGSIVCVEIQRDVISGSLQIVQKSDLLKIAHVENIYKLKAIQTFDRTSLILIAHSSGLIAVKISL